MKLTLQGKVARAEEARALKKGGKAKAGRKRNLIRLVIRDGKMCHWCRVPVKFYWEKGMSYKSPNLATFDHKKLKSQGGSWHFNNGVLACRYCNGIRADTPFDKFTEQLASAGSMKALVHQLGQSLEQRKAKKIAKKEKWQAKVVRRRHEAERARKWYPINIIKAEALDWLVVFNHIGLAF